jgi:hypothetical protein
VPLTGADVMTLRDAAERYCTRRLPADLFAEAFDAPLGELWEHACRALDERIAELSYVRGIAEEMSGLLEKLEALVERPAEFNRLIVRVDALRTLIHKYEDMYRLVIDVTATAELRRYTADRRLGTPRAETAETARQRLRRDRDFVSSFLEGCAFLERALPEARDRLRERTP